MTWTDEAENLLREISPEDFGSGCYVVDGATLPQVEGIGGFTSGLLDVALSPWLQEHGRWNGRGFACVCYPEHFPTQSQLIGVVIHEAAHHIEHKAVSRFLVAAGAPENFDHPAQEELLAQTFAPWSPPSVPWLGHGSGFIRAALHLSHRLQQQPGWGYFGHDFARVAGVRYGLSSSFSYREALGDEVEQLAGVPVSQILATPAPDAFQRLWAADTEAAK